MSIRTALQSAFRQLRDELNGVATTPTQPQGPAVPQGAPPARNAAAAGAARVRVPLPGQASSRETEAWTQKVTQAAEAVKKEQAQAEETKKPSPFTNARFHAPPPKHRSTPQKALAMPDLLHEIADHLSPKDMLSLTSAGTFTRAGLSRRREREATALQKNTVLGKALQKELRGSLDHVQSQASGESKALPRLHALLDCPKDAKPVDVLCTLARRIPDLPANDRADLDHQRGALQLLQSMMQAPHKHGFVASQDVREAVAAALCESLPGIDARQHRHSFKQELKALGREALNRIEADEVEAAYATPFKVFKEMTREHKNTSVALEILTHLMPKLRGQMSDAMSEAVTQALVTVPAGGGKHVKQLEARLRQAASDEQLKKIDVALARR